MPREKSTTGLMYDIEKKADAIMDDFAGFIDGTRVLLLLFRAKEGGHNKESQRRRARYISHNKEQFRRSLIELLLLQYFSKNELRIYLSVSPRDVQKAEREFKRLMLDMDFTGGENKRYFYENIEDKWISALMSTNPVKDRGLFILDIDQADNTDALVWCGDNGVDIIKQYRTKNGWHMVVKPFNRTLFPKEIGEVKDDGLLLLSY